MVVKGLRSSIIILMESVKHLSRKTKLKVTLILRQIKYRKKQKPTQNIIYMEHIHIYTKHHIYGIYVFRMGYTYAYVCMRIHKFTHTPIYICIYIMHTVENGSILEAEKIKWWRQWNKLERSESGRFEQNIFMYEILKQKAF